MSLKKNISQQIHQIILKNTTQQGINVQSIENQLLNVQTTLQPTSIFPSINQVQSKEMEIVYVSLTVQDILDPEYYYAFLISKPISKDSQILTLKYGISDQQHENIKIQNYHGIMDSRQTLVCVGEFYQTNWVENQWKGSSGFEKLVQLKVPNKHQFKLGQKINAVCVWNPYQKYLVFVRLATNQEIIKLRLNFDIVNIKEQMNQKELRELLLQNLNKFCTRNQSLMILFCMISEQPMFINGQNVSEQLTQILPRVSEIKIKAPLKQSLFPFKNQQGKLKQTPMQMSMAKTFVFIDFSNFSNEKQIKIDQNEIDNLRAMKMFVEEGKTIFRWQFGQSLNDHCHSGVIIKGSKILNPHFYLGQQVIEKQKIKNNPFKLMPPQTKQKLRNYIKKCLNIKSSLSQQSRNKIQAYLKSDIQKNPNKKLMIQEQMQIARLSAKSFGRQIIQFQDYIFAKQLLNDKK